MAPFNHWDVQTGEKSKCTLASLESDFVLDGELVALDSRGKLSYQLIQHSSSQPLPICCYALDLLNRNDKLLVKLPVSRRRELLEDLLAARKDPLRLSPLLQASSGEVLEAVRKLGLEGVVGKRTDSQYRGTAWEILIADRSDAITSEYQPAILSPARFRLEIVPR
jgi:ATP-dependent DNA ligase